MGTATKKIFSGIDENVIIKCFDDSMNVVGYVDEFRSLTWGYSWSNIGNWTIIADTASTHTVAVLKASTFIRIENIPSSLLVDGVQVVYGVLDKINTQYKPSGNTVTFTGYELKDLAKRRIVLTNDTYSDLTSGAVIRQLLLSQIVNPTSTPVSGDTASDRKIEGNAFNQSTSKVEVDEAPEQYTNVGDDICAIAEAAELGWHAVVGNDGGIYWYVLDGKDRTLGQTNWEPMLLDFTKETIDEATYEVRMDDKNVSYVGGDGTSKDDTRVIKAAYSDSNYKGIHRNEIFTDARNEETTALVGKGLEALNEYTGKTTIKVVPSFSFLQHFGSTYQLGDIGTFTDINVNLRLTEAQLNFENNGVTASFTFGYDKKTIKNAMNILLRSWKNMLNR